MAADPTLGDKSENTFKSGCCLFDNNYHNSSIHCFYYSCYQLLGHYLHALGYNKDQIEGIINNGNSHNNILTEVKKCLAKNKYNYIEIFEILGKIKKVRISADYNIPKVGVKEATKTKDRTILFLNEFNALINAI